MIHLIVNANARVGKNKRVSTVLTELLTAYRKKFTLYEVHREGETKELCRQISSKPGEKTIWVAGGDGTASEAINGLHVDDTLHFAFLPAGSGNDLARGIGLPISLEKAAEEILFASREEAFDYGEMELHPGGKVYFAGSSGMGYDAKVCVEVNASGLKKRLNKIGLGKLAYFLVAVKQVFVNPRFQVTVTADDGASRTFSDCIFLCMMNHKYEGGGLKMAPTADPTDGKITVTLAYGMRPLRVLFALPKIKSGRYVKMKNVETFDCSKLDVITDRKQYVHTDGEVVAEVRHLTVRVADRKLRMAVGQE